MIDSIKASGISGILALGTTFVLLVAGIFVIAQSKSRRALVLFGLVALVPLVIGVLGTIAGYSKAASAVEFVGTSGLESNREHARFTTYLGLGGTATLWVIVGGAACLKRRSD